jgi:hypothetical protein
MAGGASNEVATPFAFAVYGVDRWDAETHRRIETTLPPRSAAGWWRRLRGSTAGTASSSRPCGRLAWWSASRAWPVRAAECVVPGRFAQGYHPPPAGEPFVGVHALDARRQDR